MREWLSGRASPCQGECRGFESRLPLQKFFRTVFLWRYSQVVRPGSAKPSSPGSNPGGASKNTIYCVDFNPVSTRYGVDFLFSTQKLHLLGSNLGSKIKLSVLSSRRWHRILHFHTTTKFTLSISFRINSSL